MKNNYFLILFTIFVGSFFSISIYSIKDHIKKENCMDGIADMISEVQVEATFPDGTKLVTVHKPIR